MKKSIVVFLSIVVLCIGGIFCVDKIVQAENSVKPNMSISIDNVKKQSYEENIFELKIKLNTGHIEHDISKPSVDFAENYLMFNNSNFEIVAGSISDIGKNEFENLEFKDGKANLGVFKYLPLSTNAGWIKKCEDKEIVLRIKSLKAGLYNNENNNSIKDSIVLSYKNIEETKVETKLTGNIEIKVDKLTYKIGNITPGESPVEKVNHGQYFNVNYNIGNGTLGLATNESVKGIFETQKYANDRRLIYLIDKAAIDNVGGNNEIAKDSIKKSLEALKQEKPDVKTSLVVYGEKAEVIKVNDKDEYSIDELIAEIDKITALEISGNLGDGIRKAKSLANENINLDSSIVIVSDSNPNYYTQKSKSDNKLIVDRENKDGFVVKEKNIAEQYANDVVNEIIINEKDKTRWYGVNYGNKEEQVVLNDLIEKFDGVMSNVQNPYYDDFARINSVATDSVVIQGILEVESKNPDIIVSDRTKTQKVEISFIQENGAFVPKSNITKSAEIKIVGDQRIDVASLGNLKVTFRVKHGGIEKAVCFNKDSKVRWLVNPQVNYIVESGFYRGVKESRADTGDNLSEIAANFIEQADQVNLAIENYFGFGAIIQPRTEDIEISPKIILGDKNIDIKLDNYQNKYFDKKDTIYKVREIVKVKDSQTNEEKWIIGHEVRNDKELIKDKIYLITIDQYIKDNLLDKNFNIGFYIDDDEEFIDIDDDDDDEFINKDFRGLNVTVVDKPEHF